FGAAPKDIDGIKPAGNHAGDVLSVVGAISYRRAEDKWVFAGAEPRPLPAPPAATSTAVFRELGRLSVATLRALAYTEQAALASAGTGPFESAGTFPELRAVGSLFPQQVHVIVMAPSSLASVADLFGKRVAVAATGPAAMTQAAEVLRAHRVVVTALAALP